MIADQDRLNESKQLPKLQYQGNINHRVPRNNTLWHQWLRQTDRQKTDKVVLCLHWNFKKWKISMWNTTAFSSFYSCSSNFYECWWGRYSLSRYSSHKGERALPCLCTHVNLLQIKYRTNLFFARTPWKYSRDFIFTICALLFHNTYMRNYWRGLYFSRPLGLANLRENKILANKRCLQKYKFSAGFEFLLDSVCGTGCWRFRISQVWLYPTLWLKYIVNDTQFCQF